MTEAMRSTKTPAITFDDFLKVDIRVGTVTDVQDFPEARRPAYKLWIDFGPEVGIKKASAQITELYTPETPVGPAGGGGGQLSATTDRSVHERGADPRLPR